MSTKLKRLINLIESVILIGVIFIAIYVLLFHIRFIIFPVVGGFAMIELIKLFDEIVSNK